MAVFDPERSQDNLAEADATTPDADDDREDYVDLSKESFDDLEDAENRDQKQMSMLAGSAPSQLQD